MQTTPAPSPQPPAPTLSPPPGGPLGPAWQGEDRDKERDGGMSTAAWGGHAGEAPGWSAACSGLQPAPTGNHRQSSATIPCRPLTPLPPGTAAAAHSALAAAACLFQGVQLAPPGGEALCQAGQRLLGLGCSVQQLLADLQDHVAEGEQGVLWAGHEQKRWLQHGKGPGQPARCRR